MKRHDARWGVNMRQAVALAGAVTALAATSPTHAQTFRFNGRFRNFRPHGHHQVPVVPGLPGARYLGPGVQETYPYTPFQQPDILRNYLQMRATSPRPNDFMGGQFNPQYQSTGFGDIGYGGGPPYYGGYGGYGGVAYGGYASGLAVGGSVYPPYPPQERVIMQREIIYMPPGTQPDTARGARAEPPARTEPPAPSKPQPAAGDYYLLRPVTETAKDALEEIRRAWLNGDYGRFRTRIQEEGRVRIYLKGKFQYAVAAAEFGQMTRDAMSRLDTTAFDLDRVANLAESRAFAAGKHSYMDSEKTKREVYVSYGLSRENGRWVITEAGSSTTPIEKHVE